MRRLFLLAFVLLALAQPARAVEERRRLMDLGADVLAPEQRELGLFWGRYARGFGHGVQASTHVGGDALTLLNLFVKYRFLDRPELRASVEGGFIWPAITLLAATETDVPLLVWLPVELRATVPLADDLELSLGWVYRAVITSMSNSSLSQSSLRQELSLVRYDHTGAWYATGRVPLLVRSQTSLDSFFGKSDVSAVLTLDDLTSWGILAGREFLVGETGHLRLGLGYRHTPGILFYESLGHLLVNVDLFWR